MCWINPFASARTRHHDIDKYTQTEYHISRFMNGTRAHMGHFEGRVLLTDLCTGAGGVVHMPVSYSTAAAAGASFRQQIASRHFTAEADNKHVVRWYYIEIYGSSSPWCSVHDASEGQKRTQREYDVSIILQYIWDCITSIHKLNELGLLNRNHMMHLSEMCIFMDRIRFWTSATGNQSE